MKICLKNFLLAQITPIFILTCFALSPRAQAACQDNCLTNNNTVQGDDALFSLTTGAGNTALGWRSLFSNTDGNFNTGIGGGALVLNTGSSNTAVGAAAIARSIIDAEVGGPGIWLAEQVVPPGTFLKHLAANGMVPRIEQGGP